MSETEGRGSEDGNLRGRSHLAAILALPVLDGATSSALRGNATQQRLRAILL